MVGVIIQAVTGLDGMSYTRQQLEAAVRNGLRIQGYVFPGGLATKLAMFDGYAIEFLWLDVELAITVAGVDAALRACDAYMATKPLPVGLISGPSTNRVGIYSGRWFFRNQGWLNLSRWSDRPLWDANYDDVADPAADFVAYGGWTSVANKQYHGTTDIGAVHTIDLDAAA